jgi:hypothetical protein
MSRLNYSQYIYENVLLVSENPAIRMIATISHHLRFYIFTCLYISRNIRLVVVTIIASKLTQFFNIEIISVYHLSLDLFFIFKICLEYPVVLRRFNFLVITRITWRRLYLLRGKSAKYILSQH